MSEMRGPEAAQEPLLPVYQIAVVKDFEDKTHPGSNKQEEITEHQEAMKVAGARFADHIADRLRSNNLYQKVIRGEYEGEALRIGGDIVRYEEGNATARFLIGFGAGSSYFDCRIRFADNVTGDHYGDIIVDKNSWALGGALASGQTVEVYMQAAANKVVEEIVESRQMMQTLKDASDR